MQSHKLKLESKVEETTDAFSFLLTIPKELESEFKFKAGQYLTVKCDINGNEYRRAYSIFTAPYQERFGFMVKRLSGGKVSNYLIDNLQVGNEIDVLTPEGRFTVDCHEGVQRDHYFFAGGSGITPVMSMISEILETEPQSVCYLLYASRNEDKVIFKKELDSLRESHDNQFIYENILSQPAQNKKGGIKGLFSKPKSSWRGLKGRINAELLRTFMNDNQSRSGDNVYYVCGPQGMMTTVESFLKGKGYDSIKKEHFTNPDQKNDTPDTPSAGVCTAEVILNGETFTLEIAADKTVLDALIDLDKDPPYSCTSGACSTCMAKVTEGEVEMESCFALDDEEVAEGYVLTCQSRCKTSTLKVDFET